MIYVAVLLGMSIHPNKQALIRLLLADKTPTKLPLKYFAYIDVFLSDFAIGLLEHTSMNDYAIELKDNK